jgi:hypothetical protein
MRSRISTHHTLAETTMKFQLLIALAFTLLAVSACVVEPYGGGRGYYNNGNNGAYNGGYNGGYNNGRNEGDRGEHEAGRRVWRE